MLIVRGYVRSISLLGTVLCVLASFLCFLNFNYISLLFFVPMAGIGQGLCTPVNTILVNQFFDRHLSTASGISLTGITLASFVFPPAVTILLQTYGLRGTFLIISGLTLHAVAGALAIRPPPWMFKRSAPKTTHHENDVVSSSCPNVESEEMLSRDEAPLEEEEQALTQLGDMSSMSMDVSAANVVMFSEADSDEDGEEMEPLKRRPSDDEIIVYELQRRQQNPVYQPTVVTLPRSSVLQLAFTRKPSWTKRIHFFKKPFYYLILAHWISSSYVNFCFMVSLVDMAIGKGAQPTAAAMVLSAYSSGDLAGRLLSGWISDRGFLTREGVMTLNCAILSAVLFVVPSCDSYASLVVVTVVVGWCIGSCVILFAVLLSKVSGLENLSLAIGTTTFFMGIATLARPTLIGERTFVFALAVRQLIPAASLGSLKEA